MTNRNAEKIRQRRVNHQTTEQPLDSPKPKKYVFWSFSIGLIFFVLLLTYLSYKQESLNELVVPIVLAVTLLLIVLVWYAPKFYVQTLSNETGKDFDRENAKLKLEDDTRKTFAQIVGGIVILGGLIFSFNTYRNQVQQIQIQIKQEELAQEGQITDRFTKAVTQIGDKELAVRLGGLYALERIAKDSPKDRPTVVEILSAYIREKAKFRKENLNNSDTDSKFKNETDSIQGRFVEPANGNNSKNKNNIQPKLIEPATEVHAALTIIGRRNTEQLSTADAINLSAVDLLAANLVDANLVDANLMFTKLTSAALNRSNLKGADLTGANLSNANLNRANLEGTTLTAANLQGAYLVGANLRGADLEITNLKGADLENSLNLEFDQLKDSIIDNDTKLPAYLENRKAELIKMSEYKTKSDK